MALEIEQQKGLRIKVELFRGGPYRRERLMVLDHADFARPHVRVWPAEMVQGAACVD